MAIRIRKSGLTGWCYKVLEPGYVEPGDELAVMAELDHLPESWRGYARRRLQGKASSSA